MTATLKSIDPANGTVVGEVRPTPVDEIPAIVARAKAAQKAWAGHGLERRAQLLRSAGEALSARADEMGRLISQEMGKPLKEALGEARGCAASLAEEVDDIEAALTDEVVEDKTVKSTMIFDALGVAACITPWNFPVLMPHQVVIPALLAGNTVVMKPSEKTPLSAQVWAECFLSVLEPDVLQVVHGDEEQGKALVAADVQLVAFVGSREAGGAHHARSGWFAEAPSAGTGRQGCTSGAGRCRP